ncbi:MAG TPA: ABC transporter permease [Spirochaetia bacterium]|nr:ABC transporter permease [Spirochaetia bacterium]
MNRRLRQLALPALGLLTLVVVSAPGLLAPLMQALFPEVAEPVYSRASVGRLISEHLYLVGVSSLSATIAGLLIGIGVTRTSGRAFLQLAQDATSLAQTFPPVAVLALAVPVLGFGFTPTVVALFVYSVLPVVKNTIAGLEAIPANLKEASVGMGMRPVELLVRTELPLAARVIMAGVRTSVVLNIGTATIGATIGAGGLGRVIIAGLVRDNTAWVLTGAVAAATLALMVDWALARIESSFYSANETEV